MPEAAAGKNANAGASDIDQGERICLVMVKFGIGFLVCQRERNPELKAMQARTGAPQFGPCSFGLNDATALVLG